MNRYGAEMVGRYALYVDAGYLLAAGQWACTGTYRSRGQYRADAASLVEILKGRADEAMAGKELLRIYWYDAAPARLPTAEQVQVSYQEDVTLRVGHLTSKGEQKGVDALVILDMYDHALCGAVTDAILLAGDGDLAEGVTRAQMRGVRVRVWSFDTPQPTTSPELRRVADRHTYLETEPFRQAFPLARPSPTGSVSGNGSDNGPPRREGLATFPVGAPIEEGAREAARTFAGQMRLTWTDDQIRELLASQPRTIPREIDKALITAVIEHLGVPRETVLSTETVYAMREAFFDALSQ